MERIVSFIAGDDASGGVGFEKHDPATGVANAVVDEADADTVARAVEAARRALAGAWGKTSLEDRARLLERIADAMEVHLDEIVAAEIADTGKPITPTRSVEIPRAIANFRAFAQIGREATEQRFETEIAGGRTAGNLVTRDPLGVVGIVAPWNLPLLLLTFKIAPALVCGNTVVVKPSEHSPRTAALLAKIALKAGLPAGVLNVVHGHGAAAAGEFLTSHPDVDGISFTGETRTGQAIMAAAAKGPRPVSLELGGKNAAIILDDCDLEAAVSGTARSVFDNAGQVCLTTERVFVQRGIFDHFVSRLVEETKALKIGDPLDPATQFGPLISLEQREKVLRAYADADGAGATVLTGGGAGDLPGALAGGYWVAPTLWTGLPDDAAVCREEVFGPCAHIAVFDDDQEVIARANATEYGLASTIWSSNIERAQYLGRALETGTVWVNCWRVRDERVAFGGRKKSGVGREGGIWSLDFYSELKTLCVAE